LLIRRWAIRLARRDVEIDAGPGCDFSLFVPDRNDARQHVMPLAIDAAEAVLDGPLAASANTFFPLRDGPFGIVRV